MDVRVSDRMTGVTELPAIRGFSASILVSLGLLTLVGPNPASAAPIEEVSRLTAPAAPSTSLPAPKPIAPGGMIQGTTHVFSWGAVATASWYQLWINDALQLPRINVWYSADQVRCSSGAGVCAADISDGFAVGNGVWWVRAWTQSSGAGSWSVGKSFTLDWHNGAWAHEIPGASRFQPVLGTFFILDRETGLVWSGAASHGFQYPWLRAKEECLLNGGGSRRGFRLPTITELRSLTDHREINPSLPKDHPFRDVRATYWSTTESEIDGAKAYSYWTYGGSAVPELKGSSFDVWCVRGPQHGP